jgi:hypothetical protein
MLAPVDPVIDPVTQFGYPATCDVCILNGGVTGNGRHLIWYAGAPSTLFANAPAGSHFVDTTNSDTYVLSDAGSWVQT